MCGIECCENHIPQKNSRTRREKERKKEIDERVQKQGASVLHTTNRQDKHKTRSFQELN